MKMSKDSIIRDLEKQRAEFAYEKVEEFINENSEDSKKLKEYKSYVKKIPSLIQTNGLAATFAFMYSKKGTYEVIYKQVEKWLKEERKIKKDEEELIRWMINLTSPEYRRVTNEVMGLFVWLRRFAEGMIKDENGKEKEK
jgi:CRISPR-associated protein Cmr5